MAQTEYRPFVPENVKMREFTLRAVLLGLVLTVVLGAANAYLGLRAGQTIAATYPAAVISMAVLRLRGGTILEENLARTAGSIGESVAAGAIFTIPAFVISKSWPSFDFEHAYWKSTALMMMGGVLGVLFVSLIRRVMVEDPELPFPESLAAAEIHKAGQRGGEAAKFLFYNMGFGGLSYLLGAFNLYAQDKDFFFSMGNLGRSFAKLGSGTAANSVPVGGVSKFAAPTVSPAYIGVGYVIGLELASLNVAGSVLAWGLLVPLLVYFLGPSLQQYVPNAGSDVAWDAIANGVWRSFVRPIAVGGMMVGAAYTLFRMRKSLGIGLAKAFSELKGVRPPLASVGRLERYMSSKTVFAGIAVIFVLMAVLYVHLSERLGGGIMAAVVMLVTGFFFATVSGYLVGVIGSSNNPISGLTLSTLVIAALLMVSLGVSGTSGVVAVLAVAAVVCVSSAVAGELLQDFKVGYILGGTPRTIQIVEVIAVICASLAMYFPLMILHEGNIRTGGIGFGDPKLPAPQAGLMASLAQGIVGGDMAWPLIGVGIMFGIALILINVKSPMLVAIGMYLPLATTFAIFIGGVIRWLTDSMAERKGFNAAQRARVENTGILIASGFIAGEALVGLVTAWFNFKYGQMPAIFHEPSYLAGLGVLFLLAVTMIKIPLANAGAARRAGSARGNDVIERPFPPDRILRLVTGDITRIPVDAIVNAANSALDGGGGVDGAIHRTGGVSIMNELREVRRRIGSCPTGSAVATEAGALPARWVFHAVGPVYRGGGNGEAEQLASCYRTCLRMAEERGARSISFPSISTGAYGYPKAEAAQIALGAVIPHLAQGQTCFKEIVFVVFDDDAYQVYAARFQNWES